MYVYVCVCVRTLLDTMTSNYERVAHIIWGQSYSINIKTVHSNPSLEKNCQYASPIWYREIHSTIITGYTIVQQSSEQSIIKPLLGVSHTSHMHTKTITGEKLQMAISYLV